MAAISTTLLTVLSAGDHLLAQNSLYGGTHGLITQDFREVRDRVPPSSTRDDPASWEAKLRAEHAGDLRREHDQPAAAGGGSAGASWPSPGATGWSRIIDNTFATPLNYPAARARASTCPCTAPPSTSTATPTSSAGAVMGARAQVEAVKHRTSWITSAAALDPARLLPAAPRAQDAGAARAPPEPERAGAGPLPGSAPGGPPRAPPRAGIAPRPRARARAVRWLRRHLQLRAGRRRRPRPIASSGRCGCPAWRPAWAGSTA